ncbi:hypothetical protein GCM10009016_01730 [Halomonas beimenensis]
MGLPVPWDATGGAPSIPVTRTAPPVGGAVSSSHRHRADGGSGDRRVRDQARSAMISFHLAGPVWWTEVPALSTATVTGMSSTSNS